MPPPPPRVLQSAAGDMPPPPRTHRARKPTQEQHARWQEAMAARTLECLLDGRCGIGGLEYGTISTFGVQDREARYLFVCLHSNANKKSW